MPWKESHAVEERFRWMQEFASGEAGIAELSRKYSISRKTAYKWLARYQEHGAAGLLNRTSAPQHSPHRISEEIATGVIEARQLHPHWGDRKSTRLNSSHRSLSRMPSSA